MVGSLAHDVFSKTLEVSTMKVKMFQSLLRHNMHHNPLAELEGDIQRWLEENPKIVISLVIQTEVSIQINNGASEYQRSELVTTIFYTIAQ